MKVIMFLVKDMDMEYLNGPMEVNMKETSVIICLMEKENIHGVIKGNI